MHSTETALLRVSNDILMRGDISYYLVLVLLDLCAASGTADHRILTEGRRACMGLSGSALDCYPPVSLTGGFWLWLLFCVLLCYLTLWSAAELGH